MSEPPRNWLVASALVLGTLGCATSQHPVDMSLPVVGMGKARTPAAGALPVPSTAPTVTAPASGGEGRAGSGIATVTQPARPTVATDPQALQEVVGQLQTMGAIDPAVQARLTEDLKQTDPALWPMLLQAFRASLAYQQRASSKAQGVETQAAAASPDAAPQQASGTASAPAPTSLSKQPPTAAPWKALDVPPVSAADQVAVRSSVSTPTAAAAAPPTVTQPAAAPSPIAQATVAPPPARSDATEARAATAPPTAAAPPAIATIPSSSVAAAPTEPARLSAATERPLEAIAAATPSPVPPASDKGQGVQQASYNATSTDRGVEEPLAAAIRALEAKTQSPAASPADVAQHAYLRMLYLAAGRRDDALRPIAGIGPTEQDYWNKQLWSLATLLDAERVPDTPRRVAEASQRLSEAALKLGQTGALVVRNMTFCTEVSSYGVFARFKENTFTPGQQVLLYAEVENFKSLETPKGFHTALKSSYQILDQQGRRVTGEDSAVMEEDCQNPRRDYFVRYRLQMPKPMYDGAYTLQLTIEDTLGQKVGQSSIDFTIKEK